VTAKIQKVAADASASGHQAADVDTASQDVSAQVNQLQQLLVKIVRTSSEHVDRRSSARVDMDCAATLEAGRKTLSVRLLNLSTGGAMLAGRHGSTGDRVRLVGPGLTGGLDAVIVGNTTNATRLQFDIQPELSSLLFRFLEAISNQGHNKKAAA